MSLNSIEKEWQGFARMVFHGCQPSETQLREMKKAFFAGAWSIFTSIEEIGEPHISEEDGMRYLEERRAEILSFKKRIMAEYAETN